jgi:hypothetical protein
MKLWQVEAQQSQGKSVAAACKEAGLIEQSYYRYRKEFGGLNVEQARKPKKLAADLSLEKQVLKDFTEGTEGPRQRNLQAPERRRQAVDAAQVKFHFRERIACRIVGQARLTQRYVSTLKPDENELTRNVVLIESNYSRYGYRRVTAMLQDSGMEVGKDRVQRIWRREGLRVP